MTCIKHDKELNTMPKVIPNTIPNTRPNILFIFTDQHNASFMGCAGKDIVNTPNLDQLAKKGVMFHNAYCQNPLCVPSRASLITGRYCRNIGIYENRHILESNSVTIPRVLSAAGYRTCVIGKTHFNGEQYQGYQQRPYGDIFGQAHQPDPIRKPENFEHGLGDLLENTGVSGIPLPLTQTEICVAETSKWLQGHIAMYSDKPFYLSVNFDKPHFPIRAPKKYYEKYAGKIQLPEFPPDYLEKDAVPFVREAIKVNGGWEHYGKDVEMHERALAAYYACIEWVDDAIGRILETLKYLGLSDNTVVIYSSDHGDMAGEKGAWQKTVFFDSSVKVPMIIRWPEHFKSNACIDELVGLIDLFPTMCEIAEIETPEICDGISLVPILEGRKDGFERDAIFCESVVLKVPEHAGCMIRTCKWKYCYYIDNNEELYDMEQDSGEWNNLAENPEYDYIKSQLKARVIEFWKPEDQIDRYKSTPIMKNEKHFYHYSNQFALSDGTIFDGRP